MPCSTDRGLHELEKCNLWWEGLQPPHLKDSQPKVRPRHGLVGADDILSWRYVKVGLVLNMDRIGGWSSVISASASSCSAESYIPGVIFSLLPKRKRNDSIGRLRTQGLGNRWMTICQKYFAQKCIEKLLLKIYPKNREFKNQQKGIGKIS